MVLIRIVAHEMIVSFCHILSEIYETIIVYSVCLIPSLKSFYLPFQWALVYLGLRSFMRPCGTSGVGRLDFYHRSMSKAVRLMYLDSDTNTVWWQQILAAYFSLWYVSTFRSDIFKNLVVKNEKT